MSKELSKNETLWNSETKRLIQDLHSKIILNNTNWHKYKNNKSRRVAELLISALSQIIRNGKETDIEDLIEQSLLWIREEVKDPGCPSR